MFFVPFEKHFDKLRRVSDAESSGVRRIQRPEDALFSLTPWIYQEQSFRYTILLVPY